MSWIRWWGLAVFGAIVSLLAFIWFLIAPWIIAHTIEDLGSEALGAKVDVHKVDLGLFPTSIEISGLALTDPEKPMKNMVEFGTLKFALESDALFWKKLVVDQMNILDVKFNTQRESSGKLKNGRKTTQAMKSISDFKLPDLSKVDVQELVNKSELITLQRVKELNDQKQQMSAYWKQKLDSKEINESISHIKKEFARLKARAKKNKFNLLKDHKKWKSLKKSITAEQKKYKDLKKKFNADKKKLSEQIRLVRKGPADDLNHIMKKVGYSGDLTKDISSKLIGPELSPWVSKAMALINTKSETSQEKESEPDYSRSMGQKIAFIDEQKLPDLLIKKILISVQDKQFELKGNGSNLAIPPWQWRAPALLEGKFEGSGQGDFYLKSQWKTETEMASSLKSEVQNWQLQDMPLLKLNNNQWMIKKGTISSHLDASATNSKINLNWKLGISSPEVSSSDSITGWQQLLLKAINQQQQIDISITAKGGIDNPEINVNSSLEKVFQEVLKQRLLQESDKIKAKLKNALGAKLGNAANINGSDFQLKSFADKLNLNDEKLKSLMSGIKI